MSDAKLEACPFCGRVDDLSMGRAEQRDGDVLLVVHYYVACSNCFAYGPLSHTRDVAVAAWNRRVPPTVPEPDWSQAPENATHHLYEFDGLGWFVKSDSGRPIEVENDYGWDAHYLRQSGITLSFAPDWRTTLTARPRGVFP